MKEFLELLAFPFSSTWLTVNKPPFARWFLYLLTASVLTLLSPLWQSPQTAVHSPHLVFFTKGPGLSRTPLENVWMDGPTAAQLNAPMWLWYALALIVLEVVFGMMHWLFHRYRSSPS